VKRFLLALLIASGVPGLVGAQPPYATGRVPPTVNQFQAMKAVTVQATAGLDALGDATEKKWDSREHGWVGPVKNQGNCGSCWDFSGTFVVEAALYKSGLLKNHEPLSEQYTLNCYRNGGCSGDDNTTVLKHAQHTGLPLTADYGPYTAREGSCNLKPSVKLYKVEDWGLADGDVGYESVGSTQKIKNAIKAHGVVGCAIAADTAFMNSRPGTPFQGRSRSINHDVALVGWDDTLVPGKTTWILRNSWGTDWCDGGYSLIVEGANMVGTEPVFAVVKSVDPPPPPPGPEAGAFPVWLAIALAAVAGAAAGAAVVFVLTRKS
jgi:C1A family cysteine protease